MHRVHFMRARISGFFFLLLLSSTVFSCAGTSENYPKPMILHEKMVIYNLSPAQVDANDSLPLQKISYLLKNLYYRPGAAKNDPDPVLAEMQIQHFQTALQQAGREQILQDIVAILIEEDEVTPSLAFYRTIILLGVRDQEFYLNFQEIRRHFLYNRSYRLRDWGRYYPDEPNNCLQNFTIQIPSEWEEQIAYLQQDSCESNSLHWWVSAKKTGFEQRKIGLKIPLVHLEKLKKTGSQAKTMEKFSELEIRLKKLKSLYENGLINRDDYSKKKQQLLDDL